MKKIFLSAVAVAALSVSQSCHNDFENDVTGIAVTSGEANFSKYIAIGNSLTSGYRDGALYIDGQNESFPSMIAQQMKLAGGGEFKQPLMADNLGGISAVNFSNKLMLSVVNGALSPVPASGTGTTTLASIYSAGPYQNMGVPGAKSFHLVAPGYGSAANLALGAANPYFVRFASSATTSVLADAMAQKPTFFSLWIGANDVLSYSTSGGTNTSGTTITPATDQTGNTNPATYKSNDISDPGVVAGSIKGILDGLKSVGATKGVIANIPYVTSIPFFTTVPATPIAGLTAEQVTALTAAYAPYNAGLAQAKAAGLIKDAEYTQRLISFKVGQANGAVIADKDLTPLSALGLPSYRQTVAGDYILLTASALLKAGFGTQKPLENQNVLTVKEAAKVKTATDAYNASIASLANTYGLALVDANMVMQNLNAKSGLQFDGVKYTATFVTGGAFSLDGVHPTGRGYGVIANEFIKAINMKYKSNLPQVNPNSYSGVKFP